MMTKDGFFAEYGTLPRSAQIKAYRVEFECGLIEAKNAVLAQHKRNANAALRAALLAVVDCLAALDELDQ